MGRIGWNGFLRSLGATAAASLSISMLAVPAGASTGGAPIAPSVTPGSRYLALGDSVTFGYQEPQVVPAPNYRDAASFAAYPELLGRELHLNVVNAACPGETTASLISPKAPSNGCENIPGKPHAGYRRAYPLHVHYEGSQLAFALHYLRTHRDVTLVSLMIGANDAFLCLETTKHGCTTAAERAALKHRLTRNIHHILRAIRHTAHYGGQLAIVNYYPPSPAYTITSRALNVIIDAAARPYHVEVARGFAEFARADRHFGGNACTAGLVTQLGKPGVCGIHPSYAGQSLLAQALAGAIRIG